MFYTGWALPAPTSMDFSALLSEMRHSASASHTTSPCVVQLPLPETIAAAKGESNAATPPMQCIPSSVRDMGGSSGGDGDGAGCVLQLTPCAALSYQEMEQQLRRRASGSSDCLHVKSNLPLLAQTGVVLMECVVSRPSAPPPPTAATTAAVRSSEEKAKEASCSPAVKHALPALVIGVCGRQLPWYSLPGDASGSVGFYVAQRHIVKDGSDDRDVVVVPAETTTVGSGGGGRIGEGDVVGCLVDLVRHTLSFTLNRHVVSAQRLDPDIEDGSLYFAVGLARRPQHTTDVAVRFYSGAACLRDAAQVGSGGSAARQHSCFPLEPYVRSLALSLVHQCNNCGRGDNARSAHSAGAAGGVIAAAAATDVSLRVDAAKVVEGGSMGGVTAAVLQAAHAREPIRDLRVAAVLRSYFSARGMANTLAVLDSELDALAPSQTRHYAPPPIERDANGSGAVAAKGAASCTSKRKPGRGITETVARLSPPQETRAVWQAFAANMAELRRTVISPQQGDDASSPADSPLLSLLLRRVLWSPSVIVAFAHLVHSSDEVPSFSPGVLERSIRPRAAPSHHTPPSSSPYQWFTASVSPALLTLCLLTLRQDLRDLLHAHHAVEEVWRVLRHHLRTTANACCAAYETPRTSASCDAEETQHKEVSAFTAFFTQLMWDSHHVLPTAMAHAQHRREDVRGAHLRAGAAATASPLPLPPQAMQVLSSLSGCDSHFVSACDRGKYSGGTSCHGENGAAAYREVQHFLMCVAPSSAPPAPQPATTTATAAAGSTRITGRAALRAPLPAPTASTPPQLETAVCFLYGRAVIPAAARRRCAQSRLLQTLCSLLSHTLGTLRQLEELAQSNPRGAHCDGSRPAASTGVPGVQASVDMLGRLIGTVLKEVRQLVWRRLAHALEEANTQLSDRLNLWHAAIKAAAPQRCVSATPVCNEESTEEDGEGEATREKPATESPTASFSLQAPGVSEADEEEKEDESSAAQPTHSEQGAAAAAAASSSAPFHSASRGAGDTIRSYETATEALPSLRQVWRRVTARAALAPSRHLVTHLFVEELRGALAVAPHVAWRSRRGKSTAEAAAEEATATGTGFVGVRANGDSVRVKRPPSAEREQQTASPSRASPDPSLSMVGEQWFTEELYLISLYMKRVVKHLAGH